MPLPNLVTIYPHCSGQVLGTGQSGPESQDLGWARWDAQCSHGQGFHVVKLRMVHTLTNWDVLVSKIE